MATPVEEEDRTYANQDLTCILCKQELKKPKLLACQHSFCTECLVEGFDENKERKPFCCPTCQKEIELEDNAVENIPDNYLYNIVKEADGNGLHLTAKCIPCNEGNNVINASHKCLDCGDTLCTNCSEYHCRLTVTKHHVVVTLTDLQKGIFREEFSKRKVLNCQAHSTDEHKVSMTSYCEQCQCLVCVKCTQGDHIEHRCLDIQSVRERRKRSYDEDISKLEKSQRDQQKITDNIKKAITDTKQKWGQQETDIYEAATELYALVDQIKDEKLAELKSHYERELLYLNELLGEETNRQKCLQATVEFSKLFLEKSSDSDFLNCEHDVKARIESSQRGLSKSYKKKLVSIKKQGILSVREAMTNVFGHISRKEFHFKHKCRIGQVVEKFNRKLDIGGIYGLAFNTDTMELLVSGIGRYEVSERFNVLDENGIHKRVIVCKDASVSSDIDVNMNTSKICFTTYAIDSRTVTIVDQEGIVVNRIRLPDDDQDTNGLLRVLFYDDTQIYITSKSKDRLYKWNLHENQLTVVASRDLGGILNSPRYVCLTPSNNLVLSNHGPSFLQAYSRDGGLLWEYDGEGDSHTLINPRGVCCDEDGNIYVADVKNCMIHIIHDKKLIGNIPIDKDVKGKVGVPLILAPDGDLIYGYGNTLKRISFWE